MDPSTCRWFTHGSQPSEIFLKLINTYFQDNGPKSTLPSHCSIDEIVCKYIVEKKIKGALKSSENLRQTGPDTG